MSGWVVVALTLPLRERDGEGRCIWSWKAAPAVRAGDRIAFMGDVATVRLERRFRSLGRGCVVVVDVVHVFELVLDPGRSGVGVESLSASISMSLSSATGSGVVGDAGEGAS
jgi:hypothetical protein